MLLESFIFSNRNYFLLAWHFCSAVLSQKIEKIKEHALRLFYNDSYSSYYSLLSKVEQPTMEVGRLQILAIEGCKTLDFLNPDFIYTYFERGLHTARKKVQRSVKKALEYWDIKFGILYMKTRKT